MSNRRPLIAAFLAASAALALSACKTDNCCDAGGECKDGDSKMSMAECHAVKPGAVTSVNTMCVMENDDPVNPEITPVVWKGQKIGFCCNGCLPKWNALSDTQKDAAVAKAVKLSPPKS